VLHGESGLAGAGVAFEELESVSRQAAAEDVVESSDSGGR
jgi:hypothetical protein